MGDYIDGSAKIRSSLIGKPFFIKIAPNNLDLDFNFIIDCPVPDSIIKSPPEGWSQEWMKEHFPDCVK